MKRSFYSSLSASALLLGTITLIGCGGASSFSNPGSAGTTPPSTPQSVAGVPIKGSVFGGHAPVSGSHVYLLQPGTTGPGSIATSLITTGTANVSDPNVPLGAQYVVTDSSGNFNTGDYTCVVGQPAYIYAWGGTPGGTIINDNIVELATLGNCPSSGNFYTSGDDALQFIYLNEVSTVAAAYTFQPFTLVTHNDAWHIGTANTTQALLGIANAANTAAQLYSIQGGGGQSSVSDGEGHVANFRTVGTTVVGSTVTFNPNTGNGVVPEATIDSLADILSNCVDSAPVTLGTPTTQCAALFKVATNDGTTATAGRPVDTATAAINIARFPAGNNSSTNVDATYATDIFALQVSGSEPYVPLLSHAPNDWTIAINYPFTPVGGYSTSNPDVEKAESIEVDQLGQIWITAQAGGNSSTNPSPSADRWSPLGVVNSPNSAPAAVPPDYIFGYVSLDGGNNAWTGNANITTGTGIFFAGSNGAFATTFGSGYEDAYTIIANQVGDAFFFTKTTAAPNFAMYEYGPNGSTIAGSPFNISSPIVTTAPGPVTQDLTITAASETNSGGTFTYSFNFTYVGGTPPTPLAVGDTVPLTLTNDNGRNPGSVAATGWQNLTSVTVASVSGTTFTATGTTPTTNSNDGNGATSTAAINITAATETKAGANFTYTFQFTNVGTPGVALAVGDVVPLSLTNDPGTGTTPVAATGWNNLTQVTVASVTSTSFTASGTNSVPVNATTTNTVSTNTNAPTVAVTVTAATETHVGTNFTYTLTYTLPAGSPPLAVGDVVTFPGGLTNDPGTGTTKVPATGWNNITSLTVASVISPTQFTAIGTIPTTNANSANPAGLAETGTVNISAATVATVNNFPFPNTFNYTFTYTLTGSNGTTPTPLAAGDTVTFTTHLANQSGATLWNTLPLTLTVASVNAAGTQFTVTGGTVHTTDGTGVGATGAGTYPYFINGATGAGTYHINGATGTATYTYTNANGATGTGSYVYTGTVTTTTPPALPGSGAENVAHGAIDSAGDLWLTTETSPYTIARVTPTGTPVFTSLTTVQQPEFPSIDNSGNAWIPGYEANSVYLVSPTGTLTTLTSTSTGAALVFPFGSAVDGNGNVWITNRCGPNNTCGTVANHSTLVEINGTGSNTPGTINTAISPPTNYLPEAQYPATATTFSPIMLDPLNIAIDPSGNLWITNYAATLGTPVGSAGSVTEIVGAAAPVVTPLSVAAGSNTLGTKP